MKDPIGAMFARLGWLAHAQNLDERPGDRDGRASGSILRHGRAWLHLGERGRHPVLNACWSLRSRFCHAYVDFDGIHDSGITVSLALPPIALWLGIDGLPEVVFETLGIDYASNRERQPHRSENCHREIGLRLHTIEASRHELVRDVDPPSTGRPVVVGALEMDAALAERIVALLNLAAWVEASGERKPCRSVEIEHGVSSRRGERVTVHFDDTGAWARASDAWEAAGEQGAEPRPDDFNAWGCGDTLDEALAAALRELERP